MTASSRIVVSMPVHENLAVIRDQISNIQKFFAEMTKSIKRHWVNRRDHVRIHEEAYLPTVLTTLVGTNRECPLIIRGQDLVVAIVEAARAVRDMTWIDHFNPRVHTRRNRLTALDHNQAGVGLRPVPRVMKDPARSYIRTLIA
jgi:hypothetical protein